MNDKWKKIIKGVAPALGTVLGGPLGGMAVKVLSETLTGKKDSTEQELEAALAMATPADLIKLREIDKKFELDMKNANIDVFKLEVADRTSAREMFKVNIWPQITISALYIVGYFVVLGLVISGKVEIPVTMKETATVLLSILAAAIPMILQFWFGSSSGGQVKTAMLHASTPSKSE